MRRRPVVSRAVTRPWIVVAVAYTAVTAAMGYRVLGALGSAIASDAGDPLLNAAILAWNATHIPWTEAWFQFPIFHPTANALVLSEHLLGVSVIFTPIYWLTGNAIAAYNLSLLLSYPLCGLAMYALVWRLTRDARAAFLAGLAFAFAPYRAGQLPHIQVLTVFWAPLALLGLHAFLERPGGTATAPGAQVRGDVVATTSIAGAHAAARGRWLALFAICWALQGAANGYFLVYFTLIVGAWAIWFLVARRRWRDAALVAGSAIVAALPLAPILYRYVVAQRELGLARNLGEIASFGADIAAPLCAPQQLAFWSWLRVACAQEGELFAGVALVALCVGAVVAIRRGRDASAGIQESGPVHRNGDSGLGIRDAVPTGSPAVETHASASAADSAGVSVRNDARDRGEAFVLSGNARGATTRRVVRRLALAVAVVYAILAVSVIVAGPWRLDLGWLRASASAADKPASVALFFLGLAGVLSDAFRAMVARGSARTFYLGAALACWVLSWGPFPRLFGAEALYQAPYAWLLLLPGVGNLRVPARFSMMTVLCLAIVAGLLIAEFLRARSRRTANGLVAAAAALLLLDGWATIPVAAVPPATAGAGQLRDAPVLVQPVGDVSRDTAVVFHAVTEGWRSINGFSGYEPGYYEALRTLSQAGDPALFEAFTRLGDLLVLEESGTVRRLPATPPAAPAPSLGQRLDARGLEASCSPEGTALATDANVDTRWVCGVQDADQHITFDLGRVADVGAIVHALGSLGADFPRQLIVETSADAATWAPAWQGSPAALVLVAAMDAPRSTRVVIPFPPRPARYVRLRQTGRHERNHWSIAELEVWTGPR